MKTILISVYDSFGRKMTAKVHCLLLLRSTNHKPYVYRLVGPKILGILSKGFSRGYQCYKEELITTKLGA